MKIILILVTLVLIMSGCQSQEDYLTWSQVRQMIEDEVDFRLIDVREAHEFAQGRIDGAVLIPLGQLSERAEVELPDIDAKIVVYCRSGRRSAEAAKILEDMGYTDVHDLGGINSWPYEIVD